MPAPFFRTDAFLAAEDSPRTAVGLAIVACLLFLWGAWFFAVPLTLYEVSSRARLEAQRAAHPLEAQIDGRVRASRMQLGRQVQAGDVLVELDDHAARLLLEKTQARHTELQRQRDAQRRELEEREKAHLESQQAALSLLAETRALYREAEAQARFARQEAERAQLLHDGEHMSQRDFQQQRTEAQRRQAASEALHLALDRLEWERQSAASTRLAALRKLEGEAALLDGEIASSVKEIERLQYETDRHQLRVPVSGKMGAVTDLQPGAYVEAGDRLGTVVPEDDLQVVAYFPTATGLGRIQPGQPARLRLEGFSWSQYGSLAATVVRVGSEASTGQIRVELTIHPDPQSSLPVQHGLIGVVEVAVERLSPAALVLRLAGSRLLKPGSPAGGDDDES